MNVANLALCGFPFLGGFYSKDSILEVFYFSRFRGGAFFFLFLATMLTVGYSLRLSFYSLFGCFKRGSLVRSSEEDLNFCFPMFFLGLGALFGGIFFFLFFFESMFPFFFVGFGFKRFLLLLLTVGGFFAFFLFCLEYRGVRAKSNFNLGKIAGEFGGRM